jgi:hypothetical protein
MVMGSGLIRLVGWNLVGKYGCTSRGPGQSGLGVAGRGGVHRQSFWYKVHQGRGGTVTLQHKVAQLRVKRGDIGGFYTDRSVFLQGRCCGGTICP